MVSNGIGRHLHDQSTCGKRLTAEEAEVLKQWYDEKDREDIQLLNSDAGPQEPTFSREQVDAVLARIGAASEEIHQLTLENRRLKENISNLQNQLADKKIAQPL